MKKSRGQELTSSAAGIYYLVFNQRNREENMNALQPWEEDLAPFRLYGKLWHIGGKGSPSYLFDTGDGLLLLDT